MTQPQSPSPLASPDGWELVAAGYAAEMPLVMGPFSLRALALLRPFPSARVIDVAPESLILESTGTSDKIAGLLDVLRPFGVLEVARSGHVAMVRGIQAQAQTSSETAVADDNVAYSV